MPHQDGHLTKQRSLPLWAPRKKKEEKEHRKEKRKKKKEKRKRKKEKGKRKKEKT